jgi:uncharacterized protein
MSETNIAAPVPASERELRGFDTFLAVLAAACISVVGGGVIGVIIGIAWSSRKVPGNPAELLQTNFYAVVGLTTFLTAITLVVLLAIAHRFTQKPLTYFFSKVPVATLFKAALSSIVLMALCLALEAALKYGWHITMNVAKTEDAMNPKSWSQLGIVLVFFAAFVPFYEELLFRGYIFGWLKRVTPVGLATIISAAIFALAHGLFISRGGVSGWVGTGEIFLLGCLMAWWVSRTGSLRPSYVVHLVNNAATFILAFLVPNLP